MLQYGWGQWDQICNAEKLKKHPRSSVQIIAVSIIGQWCRAQKMIDDNDGSVKNGASGGGVKVSQQAKEALEVLRSRYDVCGAVLETVKRAETTDQNAVSFPHAIPLLVRDSIWWQKEVKVCDRRLRHMSFLYQLQQACLAYHVQVGGKPILPVPNRAALPAPWWTMREDYDSLLGVMRNGWGNWKAVCEDAELCFAKEGVQWNAKNEEKAEEKPEEEADATPTTPTPKSETPEEGAKVFPSASLVSKRLHRLVAAMTVMHGQAPTDMSMDLLSMSPRKKDRHGKNGGAMIDDWSQTELRLLRSTILRWGLPLPPKQPLLRMGENKVESRNERELFSVSNIPLSPEQKELEQRLASCSTVLALVLQQVVLKLSESGEEVKKENKEEVKKENSEKVKEEATQLETEIIQDELTSHAWLDAYPVNRSDSQRELGLYSNKLGPWEFLRIEAKLKTKTIEQVCTMSRRIEERAMERFNQSREVHAEGDEPKKEKEKEKEDLNDVVPSNVVAQRLYRRLQLYYNMQQYVWDKDESLMKTILLKSQDDGGRRNDHLSEGWDTLVHDMALIRGIRKWGFVEWDFLWSNPEMPFCKPIVEKKEKEREKTEEEKAAEEAARLAEEAAVASIMSMKKMPRELIVTARVGCDV